MLPAIRSEFRKLATIRAPWLLLAAGPLIVVAGVTGLVVSGGNVHNPATQNGQLLGTGLARWLPYAASEALDRASLTPGVRLLPQWGGGLVLLGYAAAFAAAAALITLKRDVT